MACEAVAGLACFFQIAPPPIGALTLLAGLINSNLSYVSQI
jgi:hypothetical protein